MERWINCYFPPFISPKGTGLWLIPSEEESVSTRNFVTFLNIKCRIGTKKIFVEIDNLGSRGMTIFDEWTW